MRSVARPLKRWVVDRYWTLRGLTIQCPPIPANPRSILFVCKGNICRSPFAERWAAKRYGTDIRFGSAGLHVPKSIASPESAIQAAQRFGVDLESHRSQAVSQALVEPYDMIVAMETWQYEELKSSFYHHRGKIFILPLLDSNKAGTRKGYAAFNIQDPYGGPSSLFDTCFQAITMYIEGLFQPSHYK